MITSEKQPGLKPLDEFSSTWAYKIWVIFSLKSAEFGLRKYRLNFNREADMHKNVLSQLIEDVKDIILEIIYSVEGKITYLVYHYIIQNPQALKTSTCGLNAGRQGFEPRFHGPEPCVLPLDDLPRAYKVKTISLCCQGISFQNQSV